MDFSASDEYLKHLMEGGKTKMETKSRYEILSDLESKKVNLINQEATMGLKEAELKREIERCEEELKEFKASKDINIANIKDQLASIEKSLERLSNSQKK